MDSKSLRENVYLFFIAKNEKSKKSDRLSGVVIFEGSNIEVWEF